MKESGQEMCSVFLNDYFMPCFTEWVKPKADADVIKAKGYRCEREDSLG